MYFAQLTVVESARAVRCGPALCTRAGLAMVTFAHIERRLAMLGSYDNRNVSHVGR